MNAKFKCGTECDKCVIKPLQLQAGNRRETAEMTQMRHGKPG
jgi:hypothetical protein